MIDDTLQRLTELRLAGMAAEHGVKLRADLCGRHDRGCNHFCVPTLRCSRQCKVSSNSLSLSYLLLSR